MVLKFPFLKITLEIASTFCGSSDITIMFGLFIILCMFFLHDEKLPMLKQENIFRQPDVHVEFHIKNSNFFLPYSLTTVARL